MALTLENKYNELQSTLAKMETALGSIAEMIVWTDSDGRIKWCNESFCDFLGLIKLTILWEKLDQILTLHSLDQPLQPEQHPAYLTTQKNQIIDEIYDYQKDNKLFQLEIRGRRFDQHGDSGSAVFVIRDVTKRKTLEAQLVQAQKLESLGTLAAGVAHEINTPIQYINDNLTFLSEEFSNLTDYLESLKTFALKDPSNKDEVERLRKELDIEYLKTEIPNAIKQSKEGSSHVSTIVNSMKAFSHPGGNKEKSLIDINDILNNAITVTTNEWKYIADLNQSLAPELPKICALPSSLAQVFVNIIVNAAHATDAFNKKNDIPKGTIDVTTKLDNKNILITISDTGGGIPDDIKEKIFDPFFTTKSVGKGTGQGLHIARQVIEEQHAGSIHFETTPGQSTTFFIQIPIEQDNTCCPLED